MLGWFRRRENADDGLRDPRDPIETDRLILRAFRTGDAKAFATLNADPQVMKYFPAPLTRAESDELLESLIERSQAGDIVFRAVTLKAGHFVGLAGLHRPRFEAPFMPAVEVAWRFLPAAWGRGFATEAAAASVDHGFEHLNLREIVGFTTPLNTRSTAVMERLGMKRDPEGDFEHPRVPPGHPLRPHVLYRLSKDDWMERHGR